MRLLQTIFFLIILSFSSLCLAMEKSFYILRSYTPSQTSSSPQAFNSLTNHFKKINILISQAYKIDAQGLVSGGVDPKVLEFSRKHSLKLMVLVTNVGFDKNKAHQFLSNLSAQKKAIDALLLASQQNHYDGVQFDFEGISIKDSEILTKFYLNASEQLRKNGFRTSFAIIPLASVSPYPTSFLKRKYENWAGAYDLKTLSSKADFITMMSYDQHEAGTAPGPGASYPWVEATIQYALRFIPPQKIFLGIPVYSSYWYTGQSGKKVILNLADLNYQEVDSLIKTKNIQLSWDKKNKLNYAIYLRNWLNEYLFVEDSQSFKAKLKLAKKYKLGGVSVFSLGNEDPNIWRVL